jgi:WD40 repeat protein
MGHVFISYSRRDSRFVGALADGLRERGKDVWIDIEGIRDAEIFPAALREAIDSSDGFVFVISPASVNSPYCVREVGDAVDAGKRIVPIDWERVPDEGVPEPIRVRNWVPVAEDLDATIERVVKALDTDLDYIKAHTHWEMKALEWSNKERERSLLLRGTELAAAEAWLGTAETKDPGPTPLQREYLTVSRQAAAVRQRRVATVSVAVALVSIALLVFALIQRGQAESARKTNQSRALAFASQAQATVDPERALLMAIEAAKTRATPDALFALRGALDADPLLHRFGGYAAQTCQQPAPGMSFSSSGVLAAGLCDGRIILLGRNGRVITWTQQRYPAAPLRFNPDGSTLAVGGSGQIRLYDPRSLVRRGDLLVPGIPQRIIFSGDGARMAATSASLTRSWTSVWDAHSGRLTMRRVEPVPAFGITPLVHGIGFVDGGRALAVGSPVGAVAIYASEGGRKLRTLPDKEDALIGVDPDGRWLVVGGFHTRGAHSREGVVTLWDTYTWRDPRVIATAPGLRPRNIVVSPDGSRVAVGWSDGSAAVYSLSLGTQVARFLGPPKPVSQITYSPDSKTVAVGTSDGSVRIWRAGGAEGAYTELGSRIDWDAPAVSEKTLTVITPPNVVRTLGLPGLVPLSTSRIPPPAGARYRNAWLSPSGETAVMIRTDGKADVWHLAKSRRIGTYAALAGALAGVSNDDRRMILLDGENNELIGLRTFQYAPILERARFCRGQWRAARFSDDGSTVVAASTCGELLAWNADTGKLLYRSVVTGQITGLALSRDKRTAAIASPDGRVALVDLATGTQHAIPGTPRGINSLDFGAGDRTLAAGVDDGTVRIWDVSSDRLLRVLRLQAPAMVRFTPSGRKLVVAQLTGALQVFDPCPACENADALTSRAARRVTRKLTAAERRTYLTGF